MYCSPRSGFEFVLSIASSSFANRSMFRFMPRCVFSNWVVLNTMNRFNSCFDHGRSQEETLPDAQTPTAEPNETVHPPTADCTLSSLFSYLMHAHRDVLSTSDLRTCTTWVLQACVDQSLYASSSEIRHIVRLLRCVDASCAEAYAEEIWRA